MTRPLYEIAQEIVADYASQGKGMYFGAVPYVQAMYAMSALSDMYGDERGDDIVIYLLSNLIYWRGATARRVKAELKAMLKQDEADTKAYQYERDVMPSMPSSDGWTGD